MASHQSKGYCNPITDVAEGRQIEAIKARLYDLQHHNCNGVIALRSDGWPEGKSCDYCAEVIRLTNELHSLTRGQKG